MNLSKKKKLIARTLGVGNERVVLDNNSLEEIKQAITRQDIRELLSQGIIRIKQEKGRLANAKQGRRRFGSVRMKPRNKKQEYILKVRKIRRARK